MPLSCRAQIMCGFLRGLELVIVMAVDPTPAFDVSVVSRYQVSSERRRVFGSVGVKTR